LWTFHVSTNPNYYLRGFLLVLVFANKIPLLSYTLISIWGFSMYIQYPIMNLPHELKGMTPQRLTIMFGLFWAIAYAGQTIAKIVWSFILGHYSGYTPAMIFFIAVSSLHLPSGYLPRNMTKGSQRKASSISANQANLGDGSHD
jgi:hypothetical protein